MFCLYYVSLIFSYSWEHDFIFFKPLNNRLNKIKSSVLFTLWNGNIWKSDSIMDFSASGEIGICFYFYFLILLLKRYSTACFKN